MTTREDAKTLSDGLSDCIHSLRTLLSAMDDQLLFYLSNPRLLGTHPNGALLGCCAEQVCGLLSLSQTVLAQMDERAEALSDFLYQRAASGGPPAGAGVLGGP